MTGDYPDRLPLDDGVLDLRVGSVERGDQRVPLTTRETEMLRYLAAREGEPASRDQLLTDVWEYAPGVESRTVDTTVKRLRRKLEVDPSAPRHLVSVHGVGYRLAPAATREVESSSSGADAIELPADPDSFVGRAAEVEAVEAALQSGAGLVTVRGPGGVGKSHLAREVGRRRAEAGDAVLLVDLSGARTIEQVRAEVGATLGLPPGADDRDLTEALEARVPALVLVDQCDDARDALRELLPILAGQASSASCLVTARQALGLPREREVRLDPMPADEAIELFRARAGDAAAEADDDLLARLVYESLDGLPLAIELAAARTAVLSPSEILDRLDQRFRMLASRDSAGRPQRLRDTIAWSWESLDEEERDALAACSVFRSGFELAGAEAVVGPLLPDAWVIDLIDALERKSLVHRRRRDGRSRLFLLESVRTFAEAEADAEILSQARELHIGWAVQLGRSLQRNVDGPDVRAVMGTLLAERANIRAAWQSAEPGAARGELAYLSGRLLERTGSARVGLEILEETLANPGVLPPLLHGALHLARGLLRCALNDLPGAREDADEADRRARAVLAEGDTHAYGLIAECAALLADIDSDTGHSDNACRRLEATLALIPEEPTPYRLQLRRRLGLVLFHTGRIDEAMEAAEQVFAQARDRGHRLIEGDARRLLGALLLRRSRIAEAWEQVSAAQQLFSEAADPVREALALELKGVIRAFEGRHADGVRWHSEAVDIYRRMGRRHELPRALGNLARVLLHSGRQAEARSVAEDAVATARARGALRQELEAMTLTGTVALVDGDLDRAISNYQEASASAEEAGLELLGAMVRACLAIAQLVAGDVEAARAANSVAVARYEAAGDRLGLTHHLATSAAIEALDGNTSQAEALLRRADEVCPERGRPEPWFALCRGYLHAARVRAGEHVEESRSRLEASLAMPQSNAFGRVLAEALRRFAEEKMEQRQ